MLKAIEDRKSIRRYLDRPVNEQTIRNLIESARVAPSGRNTQPWHFIIIRDKAIQEQIVKASHNQRWMLSAPVFIACIADIRARIPEGIEIALNEDSPDKELKLVIRDTTIAIEHLVLEAVNEGLGTCWVALFTQEEMRPLLGVPNDKYIVSIITVGYADESPGEKQRKACEEIIHYDKW